MLHHELEAITIVVLATVLLASRSVVLAGCRRDFLENSDFLGAPSNGGFEEPCLELFLVPQFVQKERGIG